MDDTGTIPPSNSGSITIATKLCNKRQVSWGEHTEEEIRRCYFCGSVGILAARFPRRGYGSVQRQRKWYLADRIQGKGSG